VIINFSPVTPVDFCALSFTPIYDIQGSGSTAAITGVVTTQGVVVGDYEGPSPALRGFYLQDATGDGDPATSDGIFVFNSDNDTVDLGDVVRVTGTAGEFQAQTQISSVSSIVDCGTGTVAPVDVTLPVSSATYLEQYEGMLVRFPQTLVVTEHFQLGRFGQVVMSANARLQQPTNVVLPGVPALALQVANDLNKIIVDDELNNQNPDPILFGRDGNPLSASNTLRGGDTATGMVGVMTYTWAGNSASGNAYRLRPVGALGGDVPDFQAANPRPSGAPAPTGDVRVAGMNLLNFFNTFSGCTFGVGGAPADCRGAENQTEFDRQSAKTVAAITGTQADVVGIVEIENDGYGSDSAIQELVDLLNAATAPGTYAFIDVDAATSQTNALGTDAIKVGLIYKPGRVTPVGTTAALNTNSFVTGGDSAERNRPALAQAFQDLGSGEQFIVAVNHLKSKGSACDAADAGDGQGNCNIVRTAAANELATWLASDPTGTGDPDILITGDLNSYAKEDPIAALESAGFTNLIATFNGANAYSYVFDGQWGYLDHALGSASLAAQVSGVAEWHINADEPNVLDYNTNFKNAGQISDLFAPDEFRMSDHDPVLVDLVFDAPTVGFCPVAEGVGPLRTDVYGSGQLGRFSKVTLPNAQAIDSLYGQLAAVDTGVMRFVRFLPKGGSVVQVSAPTSPAVAPGTVRWWGADVDPASQVRGGFYWGKNGSRSPRAFVLWPTYETGTAQYANVFATFDSPDNYVHESTTTATLTLPPTTVEGATVTVNVALVDVDRDKRSVTLTVEVAGAPPISRVITVPNSRKNLNLETFVLPGVPAGTSEVTITLTSPVGGDSAAIIGASANYPCATNGG
jgi:predicted extracellular nuclease